MNKKFWILLATSAILATGFAVTGCGEQKYKLLPTEPTSAVETSAEAIEEPEENPFFDFTGMTGKTAYDTDEANDKEIPVTVTLNNVKKAGKKAAKKTTVKKAAAKKTTKTASKKKIKLSAADQERIKIVKAARAEAVQNAAKYQNMNEKIAEAKRLSAQKAAAQKNAEARKNMNKAAQDAQKAAKEQAEKKATKKAAQKAEAKTAAEKIAAAKKAAAAKQAKAKAEAAKKAAEKKAAEKKEAERKAAARKAADRRRIAKKEAARRKKGSHIKTRVARGPIVIRRMTKPVVKTSIKIIKMF